MLWAMYSLFKALDSLGLSSSGLCGLLKLYSSLDGRLQHLYSSKMTCKWRGAPVRSTILYVTVM